MAGALRFVYLCAARLYQPFTLDTEKAEDALELRKRAPRERGLVARELGRPSRRVRGAERVLGALGDERARYVVGPARVERPRAEQQRHLLPRPANRC